MSDNENDKNEFDFLPPAESPPSFNQEKDHYHEQVDEENMEGFIRILELIKVYFKNVLLISHLDSLKDCVDMQVVIEKNKGYARINQ